ncbi:hypothetical protein [uncultured Ruminococcus sp.]|uniref:hypothetical protein n=1 Tax=uncultured Ruminococcus sp. TaxID=165186 RepID=UPI0026707754|nr:hypothetical protein [uncultured Ruminococcus sp.]
MLFSAYAAPPFQKSIFQKNYSMHKKKSQAAGGGSPPTLRPNFNCKKGSVTAGGGSPLTLRPNFKSEKGSVTAAAAACSPRRGIFVGENLLYNLRVILESYSTDETRTLFFFCFFFLFSKEKKKRNSL